MQRLALGHLVVLVVLLLVVVVGLFEQRLERGDGLDVGRGCGFEAGVVRLERVGLLDGGLAVGRVVDGVGAVDDALLAGRALLGVDPFEVALARLVGALREAVDALDVGVELLGEGRASSARTAPAPESPERQRLR